MREETVGDWLDDLGSAKPAPGGGAAAALMVATGAALVEMVTNLTIGNPRYADADALMRSTRAEVIEIRANALGLAAADEAAFTAVISAYKLPKDDPGRSDAIQAATADAARPPLDTARLAAQVIALAGRIRMSANPNVVSDIAVGASIAKAALESAAVNVEVNLAALRDRERAAALRGTLVGHLAAAGDAEKIIALVREGFAR